MIWALLLQAALAGRVDACADGDRAACAKLAEAWDRSLDDLETACLAKEREACVTLSRHATDPARVIRGYRLLQTVCAEGDALACDLVKAAPIRIEASPKTTFEDVWPSLQGRSLAVLQIGDHGHAVRLAEATLRKPLSDELRVATLRAIQVQLRSCYDTARATDQDVEGVMHVSVTVDRRGTVEAATLLDNATGDRAFGTCVRGVLERTTFEVSEPSIGEFELTFSPAPSDR
jgi:TonB family protein